MRQAKFPMLASMDGDQPRVRPVSPVKTTDFTAYIASFRSSHKTGEIKDNGKVELCYMSDKHDQVRITGMAEEVGERDVIQEIWNANPLLRSYSCRSTTRSSCSIASCPSTCASCANGRSSTTTCPI